MNTVLYMLAAILCGIFGFRAWSSDRRDPVTRAFVLVAALAGLAFLSFALYLLPGLLGLVYVYGAVGAMLPAAILLFLERLFAQPRDRPRVWVRRYFLVSALVAGFYLVTDIAVYRVAPRASPAQVVLAIYVLVGWGLCLWRLGQEYHGSSDRVARVRIRYLMALLGAAALFTTIEQLLRSVAPVSQPGALGVNTRTFALQGAAPPVGAVFGTLFFYFLYQITRLYRLLDLHEVFSRIFTLAVLSVVLVVVHGVTVVWVGSLAEFPVQATFQMFLASALFLGLYDPLRRRVEWLAGEWFNRPGRRLELTLTEIEPALSTVISLEDLDRELLARLQGSGRVPVVSLYLWDDDRGAFSVALQRGISARSLQQTIAGKPFTDGFTQGMTEYVGADLAGAVRRGLAGHEDDAMRWRTMAAMDADLTLSIVSGDLVLGWLNLKSEQWADGFSHDEIRQLRATVARAAVIIENIHSVEQIEEQRRLAALGTMAAGLAHEIRNPLAGIKGAAQFLQGHEHATDPAEMADFLSVIVDEVNRLNLVVSQFLDYARPFEIDVQVTDVNALISRVLDIVRAEGQSTGAVIDFQPAGELPDVNADPNRIRQVLFNLLRNAFQAVGSQGRVTVRTSVSQLMNPPHRGRDAIEISVEDDGGGIEDQDLDKVFIPFFTTKGDGTGLGLAISRRLVEAHQGEIGVRSRPGKGSIFTVRLPV